MRMVLVAAQPRLASTSTRSSPPVLAQGVTLWLQPEKAITNVSFPGRSFVPGKGCAPAQHRCGMQERAVRATMSHCCWLDTAMLQGVGPARCLHLLLLPRVCWYNSGFTSESGPIVGWVVMACQDVKATWKSCLVFHLYSCYNVSEKGMTSKI